MFSQETAKTNPWTTINPKVIPWILRWCSDFEYILCTQAGLGQLSDVGLNLICVPLYVPEWGIIKDKFLNKQAKGSLSAVLDPVQLEQMTSDTANPYALARKDIDGVLLNPQRFQVQNKKVKPLTADVKYDPNDADTLFVVFTVEGAHTLSDTFDRNKITAANVLQNLDELRTKYPVISLNLTHLEQYPFCNHAYGILFVTSEDFKPTGNRISAEGATLIKECYKRKIMVDIKHMSLASRRYLIEQLRVQDDFKPINQPLVCTHAGFTGLSYKDIPDYLNFQSQKNKPYASLLWGKPKLYNSTTAIAFNPSSINLYDEDILAVLQSGGMIGLSLDKRILGYTDPNSRPDALNDLAFEEEFISNDEKDVFLTRRTVGGKMDDSTCITVHEVLEGGEVNPDAAYYHLCHFMSHILHLINVAQRNNYSVEQALKQVCIGSDFDGIINPLWCCPTAESLPDFKKQFISEFPFFAKANKEITPLPSSFDIHQFANQLFFENGRDFVLSRLAVLQPQTNGIGVPAAVQ
jgi:microsomal dipeptidase-like Zn-dependent dipeptidase